MKKLLMSVAITLLATAGGLSAQDRALPKAPNAVYFELFGNGLLYSLNYDRLLTPKIAARVGFMGLAAADDSSSAGVIATPLMVSYLFGEGNSHFETGIGVMLAAGGVESVEGFEDESFCGAVGTATLGYRYQRPGGGFVFRAGVTPMFNTSNVAPWFGISLGYGF